MEPMGNHVTNCYNNFNSISVNDFWSKEDHQHIEEGSWFIRYHKQSGVCATLFIKKNEYDDLKSFRHIRFSDVEALARFNLPSILYDQHLLSESKSAFVNNIEWLKGNVFQRVSLENYLGPRENGLKLLLKAAHRLTKTRPTNNNFWIYLNQVVTISTLQHDDLFVNLREHLLFYSKFSSYLHQGLDIANSYIEKMKDDKYQTIENSQITYLEAVNNLQHICKAVEMRGKTREKMSIKAVKQYVEKYITIADAVQNVSHRILLFMIHSSRDSKNTHGLLNSFFRSDEENNLPALKGKED